MHLSYLSGFEFEVSILVEILNLFLRLFTSFSTKPVSYLKLGIWIQFHLLCNPGHSLYCVLVFPIFWTTAIESICPKRAKDGVLNEKVSDQYDNIDLVIQNDKLNVANKYISSDAGEIWCNGTVLWQAYNIQVRITFNYFTPLLSFLPWDTNTMDIHILWSPITYIICNNQCICCWWLRKTVLAVLDSRCGCPTHRYHVLWHF